MSSPGLALENGGAIAVMSSGDIGGAADQFHYVYQALHGDGEIVAQVLGRTGLDSWSQAGVMIREALTPTASEVFVGATGGNGWVVHRRDASTAGTTETINGPAGGAPGWVRLVREGDRLTAFQSPDGVNWTLVSGATSPMPWTVYVGLAVSSHHATLATGLFTDVTVREITGGGTTPTTPTISIVSPVDGATLPASQPVTVTATANDPNGLVQSVMFLVNGTQVGTDTTAPYSVTLNSLAPGTYRLSAVAIDASGSSANAALVTVTVSALSSSTQPSNLAITSPLAGATFSAPATITIAASPSTDGTISRMDFYGDGTLIGSRTTSPYSLTWNNVGAGIHLLSAVAILSSGTSVSSQAVPVSVGEAGPAPSTLVYSPSVNDATAVDYYTVEIYLSGGAMPVASKYLGKPSIANNEIRVDVSDVVNALAAGTYVVVVSANGQGGSTSSQPSPAFVK
jgi:hypothetical protein